jgi:hypothetical protein
MVGKKKNLEKPRLGRGVSLDPEQRIWKQRKEVRESRDKRRVCADGCSRMCTMPVTRAANQHLLAARSVACAGGPETSASNSATIFSAIRFQINTGGAALQTLTHWRKARLHALPGCSVAMSGYRSNYKSTGRNGPDDPTDSNMCRRPRVESSLPASQKQHQSFNVEPEPRHRRAETNPGASRHNS